MAYIVRDLGFIFGGYSEEADARAKAVELSNITEAPIFIEKVFDVYRYGKPVVKEEPELLTQNGTDSYDWSPKARKKLEAQLSQKPAEPEIKQAIEETQE